MLERPPIAAYLLFENPWPVVMALVLVGLVLAVSNRHRRQLRMFAIAGAPAAVALGVWVMAGMVVTEREELKQLTRELVARASNEGSDRILAMFDAGAVLAGPGGEVWRQPAASFIAEIDHVKRKFGPLTSTIRSLDAEYQSGNQGRSLLSVTTKTSAMENATPTQWLFTWRRDGEGPWRITEARFLRIYNVQPMNGMWR